jgi:pterin-4a-carbinolamine dehydratase
VELTTTEVSGLKDNDEECAESILKEYDEECNTKSVWKVY